MSGRTQIVKYKGKMSEEEAMNNGVPQEFILGPMLFIMFIMIYLIV